jgi:D-Tyr-tRNAtyr deacylase
LTEIVHVELSTAEVCANAQGFEALARLHQEIMDCEDRRIEVDCKRIRWVDAQLGACLITIAQHAWRKNCQVYFNNLAPRIREILQKNKTLQGNVTDVHGTTMPVTFFALDEEKKFAHFTRQNFSRKEMPRMSQGLQDKFYEGIDELFANSSLHSKSDGHVIAAGQFFPKLDTLSFLISDGGRGIQGSLAAAEKHFARAADAIDWAMEFNNSARSGDIPGGLGLGILKEFIGMNRGSDLPPFGPSFITRVCGFDLDNHGFRFGQVRRARSPQIAHALGALAVASGFRATNAA